MRSEPIVLVILFLLANSANGLNIATTGHVIGGGLMYGYTQCNGVKDYINGSGDQTYTRSLSSKDGEDILSSSYEYRQDLSLNKNANNTHYARIYDRSTGIEHYVSVFSSATAKSSAILKNTETGLETSFVSNSDNGSVVEGIIGSGNIGPAYNCEIDTAVRAPMKIAETHLQGKFTFDSKLTEQKIPVDDAKGMDYKVESVNLIDYQVIDGKQTPRIIETYVMSPEGQATVYYNEARRLFSNATTLFESGTATNNQTAKDEANRTYRKALDAISSALEYSPKYYNALIQKGNILMRLGEYEDALAEFQRAYEVNGDSTSLRRKGDALLQLQRFEAAFSAFNGALKLDESNSNARTQLIKAFDLMEATINKNSAAYYYFKGVKEFYEGEADASASLEKSIDLGLNAYNSEYSKDAEEKIRLLAVLSGNGKEPQSGESPDPQNESANYQPPPVTPP